MTQVLRIDASMRHDGSTTRTEGSRVAVNQATVETKGAPGTIIEVPNGPAVLAVGIVNPLAEVLD